MVWKVMHIASWNTVSWATIAHRSPSQPIGKVMLAKVTSCAIVGLDSTIVEVEVDSSRGLSSFTLVGLPDAAVKESAERVRTAIRNSGLHFPTNRLTVNLAPADLRKVGPSYDLPIALGMLVASAQVMNNALEGALVL